MIETMRITKLSLLIAPLTAGLLASTACQSAKRPATFLPPAQTQAPALKAAAPVAKPTNPANQQQPVRPVATITAPAPKPKQKPDPVAEVIVEVEKEYQAGRDNYKAGHLDAAKQNFDRAFNLLLGSTLDYREIITLGPLAALSIVLGIYPKPVLDMSAASVAQLIDIYQRGLGMAQAAAVAH